MAPLISALITAGPSLLRLVGSKFGTQGSRTADMVADVVEKVTDVHSPETAADLEKSIAGMTPDQREVLLSMQIELNRITVERESNRYAHQLGMYTQEQETHRIESKYGTDYVKETRPKIARQSFTCTVIYLLFSESASYIGRLCNIELPGANWQLIAVLLSPCLSYMGMRTIDAFSKWKTAPMAVLGKLNGRS